MATSSGSSEEFTCSHRYLETIYDFAESLSKEESEQFCRHFAEFHPRIASLSNSRYSALECINILRQRNVITQNNISELKRAAEELHLSDQTRDLERYERVMSRQDIQIKVKTNPPEKRLHLLKVPFRNILQFFCERYSGMAELVHYEEGCVLLILKVTTEVEGQLRADILSNSLSTALRQLIIENVDDESHDDLELTCEELDVKNTPSLQVENIMSFIADAVDSSLQVLRSIFDFAQASTGPFSLSVGVRRQGDKLLYEEQQHPHPTMGYQSHVFSYNGPPNVRITRVEACDNKNTGTGGSPKIISGGVGYGHVEVEVTSKFGRSFDHTIYVYGYYVNK